MVITYSTIRDSVFMGLSCQSRWVPPTGSYMKSGKLNLLHAGLFIIIIIIIIIITIVIVINAEIKVMLIYKCCRGTVQNYNYITLSMYDNSNGEVFRCQQIDKTKRNRKQYIE